MSLFQFFAYATVQSGLLCRSHYRKLPVCFHPIMVVCSKKSRMTVLECVLIVP